jgi:arabinose-5-phosphate isomerase
MDGHHLLGIITDGDLRRGLLRDHGITTKPAYALMTKEPKTVHRGASLADAECSMLENKVRALLVTDPNTGALCGILELFN